MGNQVIRENLIGTFNTSAPPVSLKQGDLVDGLNIRKMSINGGWKGRNGNSLYRDEVFVQGFTEAAYGIAVSSNNQIIAVSTFSDGIHISLDGGNNFIATAPFSLPLRLIGMSDNGQYITVLSYNQKIYVSSDSGSSFTEKLTNQSWQGIAVSSTGQHQTVTSFSGFLYTSNDFGTTWVQRGFSAQWYGVAMSADGTKQTAVVFNGQIYVSIDFWVSWTAKDSSRTWRHVAASDNGQYQTATVSGGGIYVSSDSGNVWAQKESTANPWWTIGMSSSGQYQLASAYGVSPEPFKKSIDWGQTWTETAEPTAWCRAVAVGSAGQSQYYCVSVIDNLYKSLDFGSTFAPLIGILPIKGLYWYKNPIRQDQHFLGHIGNKLLDLVNLPPNTYSSNTDLGSVENDKGFSCLVNEDFFYATSSGGVQVWGGSGSNPLGFIIENTSTNVLTDDTNFVRDNRTDTYALVFDSGSPEIFIVSSYRLDKIDLTFGAQVNTNTVSMTLAAWRGTSGFVTISGFTDGTISGSATLAQDGSLTWTRSTADALTQVSGIMGYVYRMSFSGVLSTQVQITSCFVVSSQIESVSNKWNGIWEIVDGTRVFKNATGEYGEGLGKVSVESTSTFIQLGTLGTSDALYIKTAEPPSGFGIAIVDGFSNVNVVTINDPKGWTGNAWSAYTGLVDTTQNTGGDSFAQTGSIFFDGSSVQVRKRVLPGDDTPGYWTQVTWSDDLSLEVRVFFLVSATYPEALGSYDGCIEFKNRLMLWGDKEFPNRLRFSTTNRPDCFSGSNSGYTDAFGDKSPILNVLKFYNELLVFKEKSIFLLEGDSPFNFGTLKITDTVGLASIHTAQVVEVGSPSMHRDEPLTIALWQDVDGVYALDGRKPRKITSSIENFFDPTSSQSIPENEIHSLSGFIDPINNEYHLILSDKELVHNYVTDEWYPVWERALNLTSATHFIPDDTYGYVYAGTEEGFIVRTETGLNDKDESDSDVAIEHFLTSRAILATQNLSTSLTLNLRRLWAEFKAESVGEVVSKALKDLAPDASPLTSPIPMTLINAGFGITSPRMNISLNDCTCFQIKLYVNTVDWHMEIWSFSYEVEIIGLIGVG